MLPLRERERETETSKFECRGHPPKFFPSTSKWCARSKQTACGAVHCGPPAHKHAAPPGHPMLLSANHIQPSPSEPFGGWGSALHAGHQRREREREKGGGENLGFTNTAEGQQGPVSSSEAVTRLRVSHGGGRTQGFTSLRREQASKLARKRERERPQKGHIYGAFPLGLRLWFQSPPTRPLNSVSHSARGT